MKLLVTVLALTLGSLSCAGYGNRYGAQDEELVRSAVAGDDAPEWVSGMVQTREGSIAFVGRGGGSNVLDERHAFDEALDHVRTQVANYIATRVVTSGSLHDQTDWEPGSSRFNRGYDGYDGYNAVVATNTLVHVGCMAHARRKFSEAVKSQGKNKKAGKAQHALALIQKLYRVEKRAKLLSPEERFVYRQDHAKPILDKLRRWVDDSLPQVPPGSAAGKAMN